MRLRCLARSFLASLASFFLCSWALRLNAAGIVRIRTKLKISQSELARLIGVSAHTVSLWEIGKVSPRANAKAAICALRKVGKRELKKMLALPEDAAEN